MTNIEFIGSKISAHRPKVYLLIVFMLFACATAIRIYGIQEEPYDFHPVKQFRSALTARAIYYERDPNSVPGWKRDVAESNLQQIGLLVPPFLDQAAAMIYQLNGGELLWAPRLLSVLFWLVGGVFLLKIARKIMPYSAAVFSLAFYLFLPFSVIASQSFQPDPLMVMFMIIGLYLILEYDEIPSLRRLIGAAFVSSIAILIKPVTLPILLGTFIALNIQQFGLRRTALSVRTIAFTGIILGPAIFYYGYDIVFTSGQLNAQANKSFVLRYFSEFRFWDGWLKRIRIVMGYTYFIGGLIGALLYRDRRTKALMIGLWGGYFVMCFAFNYTISTHDYYHLPLVPIVALSIGSIATIVYSQLERSQLQWQWYLLFFSVLAVALFLVAGTSVQARRKLPNADGEKNISEIIGQEVGHSIKTIHLAPYQGFPLMYYGELSGRYWPYWYDIRDEALWEGRSLSVLERYELLTADYEAEYFVVADMEEFDRQQELKQFLTEEFEKLAETDTYVIFQLR